MIENAKIIPLPSVDWGDGDVRDVVLLEITTPEGLTGLGSAYAGVSQLRDALRHYQQDPVNLHEADAEMTIPMSAIDIALWDIRGKRENQPVSELRGGRKRDRILAYATVDLPMTSAAAGDAFDRILPDPRLAGSMAGHGGSLVFCLVNDYLPGILCRAVLRLSVPGTGSDAI